MSGWWFLLAELPAGLAALAPAALGGLLTEQTGYLNIALEGLIMAAAFTYIAVGSLFGPLAGMAAALLVSAFLAYTTDLWCRRSGADSFVAGLGLNLLIPGLVSLLSQAQFGTKGIVAVQTLQSPRLLAALNLRYSDLAAFAAIALVAFLLTQTRFGLRTRALGMSADAVRMAGIRPESVRRNAYIASGVLAAFSGIALAASIGAWVPNISAGRGWIALVAVYLGGRRLGGVLLASLGFSFLLSAANRAQSYLTVPAEILAAIPYILTALVVVGGSWLRYRKAAKKQAQD
ncbi:MAG: hypothetical protein KKC64_15580 [Spirochaetes bacterium]|nr:hypothetical protein [Spirochaetota bacterium]